MVPGRLMTRLAIRGQSILAGAASGECGAARRPGQKARGDQKGHDHGAAGVVEDIEGRAEEHAQAGDGGGGGEENGRGAGAEALADGIGGGPALIEQFEVAADEQQ